MIKRRKIRLNGEWQLDGRNQVYELKVQISDTSPYKLSIYLKTFCTNAGPLYYFKVVMKFRNREYNNKKIQLPLKQIIGLLILMVSSRNINRKRFIFVIGAKFHDLGQLILSRDIII